MLKAVLVELVVASHQYVCTVGLQWVYHHGTWLCPFAYTRQGCCLYSLEAVLRRMANGMYIDGGVACAWMLEHSGRNTPKCLGILCRLAWVYYALFTVVLLW